MKNTIHFVCLLLSLLTLVSCKSSKSSEVNVVPYAFMIENDLKILDSTPVAVMQFTLDTLGQIIDSSIITKADFRKLATAFLEPNIAATNLAKLYKESSYMDDYTKSFNFNYAATEADLPVRNVLISTSVSDNSKFKSVNISKYYNEKGGVVAEQLYWKANAYCLISKTTTINNVVSNVNKKIVWGM
jgi:hypothetical protein